jgi:hypothetical protein
LRLMMKLKVLEVILSQIGRRERGVAAREAGGLVSVV